MGRHFANMIPTKITGMRRDGDALVGEFTGGVILQGQMLIDIVSRDVIAILDTTSQQWVVPSRPGRPRAPFGAMHIHVKEIDG